MTKVELIEKIVEKAGMSSKAEADKALMATIEVMREALLNDETITLTGFGSFKVVERAARKCRNPRTKEEMEIPASKVVKFTAGKQLKDTVQN